MSVFELHYFNATACQLSKEMLYQSHADRRYNKPSEPAIWRWKAIGTVRNAKKQPFCGLLHSNPAVVGRKSGSPKNTNDDICTIKADFGRPAQEPDPESLCVRVDVSTVRNHRIPAKFNISQPKSKKAHHNGCAFDLQADA
ncbi:hypothetical protein [Undibacterium luofuense]|uniref:Uncharacterized protein n=1 Tax=Undibacterium luofuense TaxID=2828733 RepID=A0A941I602_9BURK|nr:hypothetical protein [Undibacterium luofuense]MBR7781075.1 hypothetical protein [Undibacterium luofuense]